jgi:hypothetical protein
MQNAGCLHVVAEISIQVQRNSPPHRIIHESRFASGVIYTPPTLQ